MNLRRLWRAARLPPHLIARKMYGMASRVLKARYRRFRDTRSATFDNAPLLPANRKLHRYFQPLPANLLEPLAEQIGGLAGHYLEHRFDLLGSGWVQVKYGMRCRGVEGHRYDGGSTLQADNEGNWLRNRINPPNLRHAQLVWRLIDAGYVPIDWQLDFKSGYRWHEDSWYLDIAYRNLLGVDVKVPWELARMQHLPQLAWA